MEEIEKLQYQEQILIQELELVRAKLKYVRLCQQSEPQKEISSPSSSQSKDEAIPMQTAIGKESTNPLMVVDLPKIQTEVQTSKTLVKPSDFNLRPNGGIQIPQKSVAETTVSEKSEQAIQKPKKSFYVVYNGPNAGIYEDWNIAKLATNGVPNVQHKKFTSFLEAKVSGDIYTRQKLLPNLQFIDNSEGLRPNNFCEALKAAKKTKVILGKLPTRQVSIKEDTSERQDSEEITLANFQYCYETARRANEEKFIEEKYFTSDGKNLSLYNFVKNANPEQVFEAFQYGLVKQIYPSSNLQELSYFPKQLTKAIKYFRKKCVSRPDADIFLKIDSSIPLWNEEGVLIYRPHHLIQMGICKEVQYSPSKVMDCKIEEGDLKLLAKNKLTTFCGKVFSFYADDKIFVNYLDDKTLIYSKISKQVSQGDGEKFFSFQKSIVKPNIFGYHYEDICSMFKKYTPLYSCERCTKNMDPSTSASGEKINTSGATTKEKEEESAQTDEKKKKEEDVKEDV